MHITREMVAGWERRYGRARVLALQFEISPAEMAIVRGSMRRGRAHDITLFIFAGERLALIRKALFPPGAFRAPSGGLDPHETLELGAVREALEETGLDVVLGRYLLRVRALFTCGEDAVPWVSHVFSARAVDGELQPLDRDEIVEAKYGDLAELQGPIREKLLRAGLGLFRYRVALTDATVEELHRTGELGRQSALGPDCRAAPGR